MQKQCEAQADITHLNVNSPAKMLRKRR